MDSKEFGLVAAQQLFKIESLHYGFWENSETASIGGIVKAGEKHTSFLCEYIKEAVGDDKKAKILDFMKKNWQNGINVCLSYLLRINRNAILLLYWIFF